MCGIAGFVGRAADPRATDASLRAMCGAIRHRGPDDEGRHVVPGIALGMRRLSIIDVSGGHQPIFNEDESVVVVFNGEIYNHHQIRTRLTRDGHRLRTHSDTETLVHLYEDEGERMVHSLRGMFGFAIWDARRERLFVARDRLGIKPLYYWETDGGVAFASELRSFLALESFPRELDPDAVAEFLALGYVPEPACIFRGVRKLPPGHSLTWDRAGGGVRVERYWTPVRPELPRIDEREATEELLRLLDESVRCHLESEVPLGAFLSGGIDSSTVVALMARAMDRQVETFSIGFDEEEHNEAPHAATVARDIGTKHTELIVRPDADALVDEVVQVFDEPFADASMLPTFLVAQLARRHVTVALSGDGGDELFGGYTRYGQILGQRPLPGALRSAVGAVASRLPHAAPARNRLLDLSRTMRGRYAATVAQPLAIEHGGVARPEIARRARAMDDLLGRWFDEAGGRDFASQMTFVDMLSYLPGDILTKVDRTSMAVSLEARVPVLDHVVAEFAASLPSALKLRDGTGKWILRKAIEGLVPPQVLSHPKRGFGVPLRRWFRGELRPRLDALLRPDAPIYEWVDPDAVRRVVGEHLSRRRDRNGLLWRLLVLDLWLRALARGDLSRPSRPSDALSSMVQRARSYDAGRVGVAAEAGR
jgi:asparagine synthase (glutamine-hydrolysing)